MISHFKSCYHHYISFLSFIVNLQHLLPVTGAVEHLVLHEDLLGGLAGGLHVDDREPLRQFPDGVVHRAPTAVIRLRRLILLGPTSGISFLEAAPRYPAGVLLSCSDSDKFLDSYQPTYHNGN